MTDVFEPGSTNKVVTIAAALEAGLVTPETEFIVPQADQDRRPEVRRRRITLVGDDRRRHPAGIVERRHDPDCRDARQGRASTLRCATFGFGKPTGLEFPGEAPGILLPSANYNDTSMASMPIGNGIAVTALQMLDVYATLANNGVARQPRLVAATIDDDGQAVRPRRKARPARWCRPRPREVMREMLAAVVTGGTGTKAAVPGYTVAGKTGTARKPPYEKPPYRYVSSFVGFAPAENARLATIVVIDESAKQFFGGEVAAPVFSRDHATRPGRRAGPRNRSRHPGRYRRGSARDGRPGASAAPRPPRRDHPARSCG